MSVLLTDKVSSPLITSIVVNYWRYSIWTFFKLPRLCNYTYLRLKQDSRRNENEKLSVKKKVKDQCTRENRDYFHGSLRACTLSVQVSHSSLPPYYSCNSRDECCFFVSISKERISTCVRFCTLAPLICCLKKSEEKWQLATCACKVLISRCTKVIYLLRLFNKVSVTVNL